MDKEYIQNEIEVHQIDLKDYTNGLYLISLKVNGLKLTTRQFVVARTY